MRDRQIGRKNNRWTSSPLQLVADLDILRDYLQAPKVDLLGWSWRGFLVMAYAVKHDDNVRRMVLVGSAPPRMGDNIYLLDSVYLLASVFRDITSRHEPDATEAGKVGCQSERIDDYMAMEFHDPHLRERYVVEHRPFAFVEGVCVAVMQDAIEARSGARRARATNSHTCDDWALR